ncbi:hypothetical protein CA773_12145, partial [Neisseria gonorrhoeae]
MSYLDQPLKHGYGNGNGSGNG